MKKLNPAKFLFGIFALCTFASVVGAVSSTLAWYAYITRATLSYSGTAVNSTVQLQVGIDSEVQLTGMPSYVKEVTFQSDYDNESGEYSHYYYFAEAGAGLTSSAITKYLEANDYATNALEPTTSGSFIRGGNFGLKKAPTERNRDNSVAALTTQYVKIPFVFRVLQSATPSEDDYVEGQELWLTAAEAKASSANDGDIYKAIRVYIDRTDSVYQNDFILNPSATTTGSTKVGGVLDISGDEYFDYDNNGEIMYGEYTCSGDATDHLSASGYVEEQNDPYRDLNGSGITDRRTTFVAKHRPTVKYYDDLDDFTMKTASYESLSSIAPVSNATTGELENADENNPTSICTTADASDHYLGRATMSIYLEGWDFSVIDEEQSHKFDLGLTFEINRINS